MWMKHNSRVLNLNNLIAKDFALETSLYKAINIYDLMIFNNYTFDELSQNIFKDSDSDSNQNNGYSLIKSFYEDLQYAFNNKKEKNKLSKIYDDFENVSNFTCEYLYEMNNEEMKYLQNNSEIKNIYNIKEILIEICKETRVDESNDIISAFEYHFQYNRNNILYLTDFSYEGLINHINSGIPGKITVFFNCIIIYVLNIINVQPLEIAINKLMDLIYRNILITEAIFMGLDILYILVIFVFILKIKNFGKQIILLKKIFKIFEIEEQ